MVSRPQRRRSAAIQAKPSASIEELQQLRIKPLWSELKNQHIAFWFLCAYFFFEYVRPQSLYPSLDVLPWTQIALAGTVIGLAFDRSRAFAKTPLNGLVILFCIVLFVSGVFAYSPAASWSQRNTMLTWVIVYFVTPALVNSERRLLLFILAYGLFNLKMSQHGVVVWAQRGFSFAGYGVNGAPGWFRNSGEYAIQMLIFGSLALSFVIPLAKYWGRTKQIVMWAVAVSGYMAVMGASSRGAQIGLAVIAITWVLKMKWGFRSLLGVAIVSFAIFSLLPDKQLQRFEDMGSDPDALQRLAYWEYAAQEVIPNNPGIGVGYANWLPYVTSKVPEGMGPYGIIQQPHNIYIQAAAELGLVGLAVFVLLIVLAFGQNAKTRKIADSIKKPYLKMMAYGLDAGLIGYLVAGTFVSVFYYPFFWIQLTFIVTLNTVTRRLAGVDNRSFDEIRHTRPRVRASENSRTT